MIVSISAEIALDFMKSFAGGLGVLEGDKFYAAARMGVEYTTISLFYPKGYVRYEFSGNEAVAREEDNAQALEHLVSEGGAEIETARGKVSVEFLSYKLNKAKAVFVRVRSPDWAVKATERLYIDYGEDLRFYKYLILAKAAVKYIDDFVGWERVDWIDLQESYPAFMVLMRQVPKYRVIIHTPAPWGHPSFSARFFKEEFGFDFPFDPVVMTELALGVAQEGVVVSKKMLSFVQRTFPHFSYKVRAVTNAVEVPRWQHEKLRQVRTREEFRKVREEVQKAAFKSLFGREPRGPVLSWVRRVTQYKRPDFAVRLAEEFHKDAEFVLGGRPHPTEGFGVNLLKEFKRLGDQGKANFLPNPGIEEEKRAIWASSVWLFTPFSGWEASGTSFMKAGVNGVPSVASIDGAVPEIIRDGFNGWLYGENRLEPVPPDVYDHEYEHLRDKVKEALDSINSGEYWEIAWNAFTTFNEFAKMERLFLEYYGYVIRAEEASARP